MRFSTVAFVALASSVATAAVSRNARCGSDGSDQHVLTANGETAAHNMVTGVYIHTGVETKC
jgi:hypothetical protein